MTAGQFSQLKALSSRLTTMVPQVATQLAKWVQDVGDGISRAQRDLDDVDYAVLTAHVRTVRDLFTLNATKNPALAEMSRVVLQKEEFVPVHMPRKVYAERVRLLRYLRPLADKAEGGKGDFANDDDDKNINIVDLALQLIAHHKGERLKPETLATQPLVVPGDVSRAATPMPGTEQERRSSRSAPVAAAAAAAKAAAAAAAAANSSASADASEGSGNKRKRDETPNSAQTKVARTRY